MKVSVGSKVVKVDLNYKFEIFKSLKELQDYESIEQEMTLFKLFVSMFLYPDFETMTEYENEYGVFLVEV